MYTYDDKADFALDVTDKGHQRGLISNLALNLVSGLRIDQVVVILVILILEAVVNVLGLGQRRVWTMGSSGAIHVNQCKVNVEAICKRGHSIKSFR